MSLAFLLILGIFVDTASSASGISVFTGFPRFATSEGDKTFSPASGSLSGGSTRWKPNGVNTPDLSVVESGYIQGTANTYNCQTGSRLVLTQVEWDATPPTTGLENIKVTALKYALFRGIANGFVVDADVDLVGCEASNKAIDDKFVWLKNAVGIDAFYTYEWAPSDCPLLSAADLSLPSWGFRLLSRSKPAQCEQNRWEADHRIQYLKIEATFSLDWDISSISPVVGENKNPGPITISGVGLVHTPFIQCRFTRTSGRQIFVEGTSDGTTVTCTPPSIPSTVSDSATVDVTLNNGESWTNSQLTYTWQAHCPDNCSSNGICDFTTGKCACNGNYVGTNCATTCATVSALPGELCTSCLAVDPKCSYCGVSQVCGTSCSVEDSIALAVYNSTSAKNTCPIVYGISSDFFPLDGSKSLYLNITGFTNGVSLNCSFEHLGDTPITYSSQNELSCSVPVWSIPDPNPLEFTKDFGRVIFTLTRNNSQYSSVKRSILFGTLPNPNPITVITTDRTSVFATIGAVTAIGVVILVILVFLFIQYRRKLAADKFKSLFDTPIFSLDSAFNVQYLFTRSVRQWSKKYSKEIWYLEEMLVSDSQFMLNHALTQCFETQEANDLTYALVYIAETSGVALSMIKNFMEYEINTTTNGAQLFRQYNIPSKMWTGYLRLDFGLEFLHCALAQTMYEVCTDLAYGDTIHLDPDLAMEMGQDVSKNKYVVLGAVQTIFDSILASTDTTPQNMRILLSNLKNSCNEKFPEFSYRSMANFVFLRLFCPAIASPEVYGLLTEEPDANSRDLLILITRVLQNLASGVKFGIKDVNMTRLNDFIESNLPSIQQYLDNISSLGDCDTEDVVVQLIPEGVKEVSLALIYDYIYENNGRIISSIQGTVSDSQKANDLIEKIQAICSSLGPPIKLGSLEEDI